MFEDLLRAWDGEEVAVRFDAPTQTWMFVCIHSTVLGPASGGTRMKPYVSPHDALRDGLRLAGAMTSKNAVAGLPLGGGKAVLAVPELPTGPARRELLLRYGDLVESLHGTYWTACDMNTSSPDMDVVAERCSSVFARTEAHGGSGTSAPATADGVFAGIRTSVAHAFGTETLEGRTVLVQGLGAVGGPLALRLAGAGARPILTDVDDVRVKEFADELDAEVVPPDDAVAVECDVFSPCATGGVLTAESIPRLQCRVVAGAANNQLGEREDAERLAARGILYAPDYVVNAGGIIHLASLEMLGEDLARRDERVRAIGGTLTELFRLADAEGISTGEAAERMVEARLEEGEALMARDLAAMECVPCKGGIPPLTGDEIRPYLSDLGNEWEVVDAHHLEKIYRFKNFREALAYTNRVGELAEEVGHHPDIELAWGRVKLTVFTHKIGGLHEADFVFAAKADRAL